jgi:dynein heavy chain
MKKVYTQRKLLHKDTASRMREFVKFNDSMDRITKSLEAYLEEKRMQFPRFYFISNEELFTLLAE